MYIYCLLTLSFAFFYFLVKLYPKMALRSGLFGATWQTAVIMALNE